jgi:dihydrodipicolinate synthase/N-acetylneuraminate lyase
MQFGGVYSVLPSPFTPSGDIDPESLARVIDLFLSDGVNGFTALGVTSEVARLTDGERDRVLDTVLGQVNGRVPVVAGTTAEGVRTCIELTRRACRAGAAAVMISPPRMPKINSDAVARHFAEVASAVDVPIIVQDYPPISGYAMEPALLARIVRDVPAARTIKLEDPPTPFKTARILEQTTGLDVAIFGGLRDDRLCVSADPRPHRDAVSCRKARRGRGSVLPESAADAIRVPGRHRHGDSQRGAQAPRRRRERRHSIAWRAAGRQHARRAR